MLNRLAAGCLALLLCAPPGRAESAGNSLEIKNEVFWDRNGVWNVTPAFVLRKLLSRNWSLSWEQEVDVVSGASRRIGSDRVGPFGGRDLDGISGASKIEVRHSENPVLTYADGNGLIASGSFYYSREDDYVSRSPAASLAMDFNERNTTVGLGYSEYYDSFRPRGAFAGQGGEKRIRAGSATLAQTLTSLTLAGVTATYVDSRGFLGHPYNPPVDATGTLLTEAVPGRKRAGALSLQLVQGFLLGERLGSINLDGRRYLDSWGLKSSTLDVKLSQYLRDGLYLRIRGRYYNQTGAAFAKEVYAGDEAYRTADVRWYPFSSFLVGAKLSGAFPEAWEESAFLPDRWDVKYDHMLRDTRGDPENFPPGEPRRTRYQQYGPDEQYLQGVFMVGLLFGF